VSSFWGTGQTNLERLNAQHAISSTTLAMAQYNKETGHLKIAVKGDSSVVVFRVDGTFIRYYDPDNSQLFYDLDPDLEYSPRGEKIEDIELKPGDVVMMCSDGADEGHYVGIFDELNVRLVAARKKPNSNERLDRVAATVMGEKLALGIGDDVSVIMLEHK